MTEIRRLTTITGVNGSDANLHFSTANRVK